MNKNQLKFSNKIQLPTLYGDMNFIYSSLNEREAIIIFKDLDLKKSSILIRIHSSCVFSESFKTIDCDCSSQLSAALKIIFVESGLLIYLFDEGRGAGLFNKFEAIRLQQDKNINTAEAFMKLGLKPDEREFDLAIEIIKSLIGNEIDIELLTNNPHKTKKLIESGLRIVKTRPIIEISNEKIRQYLLEKKEVLGHIIDIDEKNFNY